MVSVSVGGLSLSTPAREERLRHAVFEREKGFVVTTIGKVVKKFISTLYVTVMTGTDAAKAKCKAVRNRAISVMRMTR